MSNPTSNFGWQMPTATDLVTDLPADFEVFGQAVDTALMDLKGGTTGQVLKKNTNADMDFVWSADSAGMTNPMTTTGDTIYSSSGSTPARLGIGSTGNVLTVAGGVPTWAAPSGASLTLAQVATGSLTGTSISVTSLSSYDNLIVVMNSFQSGTDGNKVSIRINGSTDSVNDRFGFGQRGSTTLVTSVVSSNRMEANTFGASTTNDNRAIFVLENCKNAGFTRVRCHVGVETSAGYSFDGWEGVYRNNQTVSSITLVASVAWTAGTYTIYGA